GRAVMLGNRTCSSELLIRSSSQGENVLATHVLQPVQLTGKEPGASLDFRCFWGSVPRGSALDDVGNKSLESTQAVLVQLAPQEPARWAGKRQALHIFLGSRRFGNYRKQRVQRAC